MPGYDGDDQSAEKLKQHAGKVGYPLLIKAVAGGGGNNARRSHAQLRAADKGGINPESPMVQDSAPTGRRRRRFANILVDPGLQLGLPALLLFIALPFAALQAVYGFLAFGRLYRVVMAETSAPLTLQTLIEQQTSDFLVASGFTLVFGLMRNVNLAHGSMYLLGAYIGYEVAEASGSWFAGLGAAFLAIAVVGILLQVLVFRRMEGDDLRSLAHGVRRRTVAFHRENPTASIRVPVISAHELEAVPGRGQPRSLPAQQMGVGVDVNLARLHAQTLGPVKYGLALVC